MVLIERVWRYQAVPVTVFIIKVILRDTQVPSALLVCVCCALRSGAEDNMFVVHMEWAVGCNPAAC